MATKRKKASKDYKAYLRETLADPNEAAEYLNAALEEGDENVFLLALRDVAEAHGIAKLAGQANLNRESTYKMLSEQGNPRLSSLWALLDSIGLRLSVESK
ncbi:MAG TPA: addiction module antidote protein [Blastocatellia bacterium]|nr:addiction module antidote protein [Blastocatellia bacterium]